MAEEFNKITDAVEGSSSQSQASTPTTRAVNESARNVMQRSQGQGGFVPPTLNTNNILSSIPALRLNSSDFNPDAGQSINKGQVSGRFVNAPIFAANFTMPYSAAASLRNQKLQAYQEALRSALKPVGVNAPQAKHPKFQKSIDQKFLQMMGKWQGIANNLQGGWDNLVSGRTPESLKFNNEIMNLELMKRNADFLVDGVIATQEFETRTGFAVNPKIKDLRERVLLGVQSFETENFEDIAPMLSELEVTMDMMSVVEPYHKALRTQLETTLKELDKKHGDVRGDQYWLEATTVVNDFLGDDQIDILAKEISRARPDLFFNQELFDETQNERFAKTDQLYDSEDIKLFLEALVPEQVRKNRQVINPPGQTRTNVKINFDPQEVTNVDPTYLTGAFADMFTDPANSNNVITTENGSMQMGGRGVVSTFRNGQLVITPLSNFEAAVRQGLLINAENSGVSGTTADNNVNASLAAMTSADFERMAAQVHRSFFVLDGNNGVDMPGFEQREWYENQAAKLRKFVDVPEIGENLMGLQQRLAGFLNIAGSGQGVFLSNGDVLKEVNEIKMNIPSNPWAKSGGTGKNRDVTAFSLKGDFGGAKGVPGVYITKSADEMVLSREQGGAVASVVGNRAFVNQGLTEDYKFVIGAHYAPLPNGDYLVMTKKGEKDVAYTDDSGRDNIILSGKEVDAMLMSSANSYLDAYDAGSQTKEREAGLTNVSRNPSGGFIMSVEDFDHKSFFNPDAAPKFLSFIPDDFQDFAGRIVQNANTPEGLIGQFNTGTNEMDMGNSNGYVQYAIPEPYARFLYGAYNALISGTPNDFKNTLERLHPDKFSEFETLKSNSGIPSLADSFDFINEIMLSIVQEKDDGTNSNAPEKTLPFDPSQGSILWETAIRSTIDAQLDSRTIARNLVNLTKNSIDVVEPE